MLPDRFAIPITREDGDAKFRQASAFRTKANVQQPVESSAIRNGHTLIATRDDIANVTHLNLPGRRLCISRVGAESDEPDNVRDQQRR